MRYNSWIQKTWQKELRLLSKIRMPGIAAMQLATAPGSHVAGFVPEAKVWLIKFLWLV
jgi:hypothetical protein